MKTTFKIIIVVAVILCVINILFMFKIQNINIIGNTHVSDYQIATSLFNGEIDRISIVFFIKQKVEKKKSIPMVNTYEVKWISPFSIDIVVDENQPIAFLKRDVKNVYFDKNGSIIEITDNRKYDTIEVIGISVRNYEKGDTIDVSNKKVLKAILNISNFLKEHGLKAELLEVKQNDELYIYLGEIVAYMGGIENMEIKLLRLNDIYSKIAHLKGTLDLSKARENMLDEQYIFKKS